MARSQIEDALTLDGHGQERKVPLVFDAYPPAIGHDAKPCLGRIESPDENEAEDRRPDEGNPGEAGAHLLTD